MSHPLQPTADSVHRLVRALSGADSADVLQDAWLGALRKRIPAQDLARWIGGAVLRIARSRQRSEARRREHEARAAHASVAPTAHDTAVRMELVKRVVAAVDELEEPFRSAILLRYFEDLPPRAIARHLGIPVNTARSRVRRGIETLRERLGPSTLLALAPLRTAPVPRAPRARPALGWEVVALLTGTLAVVLALERRTDPPAQRAGESLARAVDSAPAREAAHPVLDPLAPPSELDTPELASTSGSGAARAPQPSADEGRSAWAEIRGVLRDDEGRPVAGAAAILAVDSVRFPEFRALRGASTSGTSSAVLKEWRATSTADGRFALRFEPFPQFGYALEITHAEHVAWRRAWPEVAAGELLVLGELHLERGATIEGRLVDSTGRALLLGDWEVSARAVSPALDLPAIVGTVDRTGGRFRIQNVPPGPVTLSAASALAASIEGPTVDPGARGYAAADLVYAGPDLARRLLLLPRARDFPDAGPAPATIRLLARGAAARSPARAPFVFDDLDPGAYTVTIDDERFLPWRVDGIEPGQAVRAELEGSSALILDASARDTTARVERFAVEGTFRAADGRPRDVVLCDGRVPLPGGRLSGLVAGDYELCVCAEGFGLEPLVVLGLRAGETRTLALELGPGSSVSGRVRRADGEGAAGVLVSCLEPAARDDAPASPVLRWGLWIQGEDAGRFRREIATTRSDDSGAFHFDLPRPGAFVLAVLDALPDHPATLSFSVARDESVAGLELVLPPAAKKP